MVRFRVVLAMNMKCMLPAFYQSVSRMSSKVSPGLRGPLRDFPTSGNSLKILSLFASFAKTGVST